MTKKDKLNSFLMRAAGMGVSDDMTIQEKRSILLNNMLSQNDGIAYLIVGVILHTIYGFNLVVFLSYILCATKFLVLLLASKKMHLLAKVISIYIVSLCLGPILFAGMNGAKVSYMINLYFVTMMVYAILSFNWNNSTEKRLSIISCCLCLLWTFGFRVLDQQIDFQHAFILDESILGSIFPVFACVLNFTGYLLLQSFNIRAQKELEGTLLELEDSSALQQAVFDSVGVIIISTDASGTITSFNKGAEKLLGYTATEVINEFDPTIFHDPHELADKVVELSQELNRNVGLGFNQLVAKAKDGLPNEEEWTLVKKNSERFPANVVSAPIKHNDGSIIGFTIVATDITDRKKAGEKIQQQHEELLASEEELRQNLEELQSTQDLLESQQRQTIKLKERFELAITGSNDGIWDWDILTNEVYYSPRWKSMLGYDEEDIPSTLDAFGMLLHPDETETVFKTLNAYLAGELDEYRVEMQLKEKSGTYRWVLSKGVVVRDEEGKPIRMSGSHMDMQEIKEKEMLIQTKNEELLATEEEIRQNSEELMTVNEHLERTKAEVEYAFQKERNSKQELEQAMEELKDTQSQLIQAEKLSSLGQLTAGVAHEINNPINFVYAGANTLKDVVEDLTGLISKYSELKLDTSTELLSQQLEEIHELKEEIHFDEIEEDIKGLVGDILLGADRTQRIVHSLKTFSRLDEKTFKKADLRENLEATLIILNSQLENRLEVVKDYEPHFPMIDCFIGQINQVFMNLITNAIQAIEGKGTIYLKLWSNHELNQCYVQIRDTGVGIKEEDFDSIFDPFFTTKDIGKGTGLGLSIVHGILNKHNASIKLESKLGEGTTFTITFFIDM